MSILKKKESGPDIQPESRICQLLKQDYSDFRVKTAPEPHCAYTSKSCHFLCVYTQVHTLVLIYILQ